jgi:uncharacterized protein HemX
VSDLAKDLEERIKGLESKADQAREAKEQGGIWGWLIGLVVAAALSIGAFFLLRKLNKKNEELAKLRTQIEQERVTAAAAKHEALIAQQEEYRTEKVREAARLMVKVNASEARLREETARYAEAMTRVIAAQNWEDMDRLNQERRE